MTLLRQPHHDGSGLYVDNPWPEIGESVTLRLRVPAGFGATSVEVRHLHDGSPQFTAAQGHTDSSGEQWWTARVRVHNPFLSYRWLVSTADAAWWVNAAGAHPRDVPDSQDFVIGTAPQAPGWVAGSVAYQIFPDRFARSKAADGRQLPDWAIPADWQDPVQLEQPGRSQQIFGGDLDGVREHLDHIAELGANLVYLTPFFPSRSNHRYDASSFTRVDPLLGGDEAMIRLADEIRRRGMRLMGDITTNHTGVGHEWFGTAMTAPDSPEHSFYFWTHTAPGYATWLGEPTLPKLNWTAEQLMERFFAPEGVVAQWLQEPFGLDGWRVDVAHMTGRHGALDDYDTVQRAMRARMDAIGDKLLVAEHPYDLHHDVRGDGWHGAMNYAGFTRPLWNWLRDPAADVAFLGSRAELGVLDGVGMVATMTAFNSQIPWSVLTNSFALAGSHDTGRILTAVGGDPAVANLAVGLALTLPGLPMLCYGDEVGLQGIDGEDARRPMPWRREDWNQQSWTGQRELVQARRSLPALQQGGLRWVHAEADQVAFLRESPQQRALVTAARRAHQPVRIPLAELPGVERGELALGEGVHREGDELVLTASGPGLSIWVF